ncbi:hypothetical protein CO174_03610 [Candidatus Uhrbacteria bacterium CG_4_9_14_3_um_filter_50_9]|uniref:Uncharacterized protein n=1 Tax=Candidatus Uhrbacteria bacterium CG_4_9_14_3_um_filter_50_9 TaxID=1975035 RepID=A0A2M7XC00_9BACT|nr:MAG: hypothetical protein CO174_03610 [Candidatus Uhrbacteria bacterium CG_4_9_14_3_um_filter_50_9]
MSIDNDGYSFSSSPSVIEYEFLRPKSLIFPLIIFGAIAVIAGLNYWSGFKDTGLEAFTVGTGIFFITFFLIGPGLMVYQLKRGLRSIIINGRAFTLRYPEEQIELSESQLIEIHVRERKDDGKMKGSVRFKTTDERKFNFTFLLGKKEGREAFEWFKAIADKKQSETSTY